MVGGSTPPPHGQRSATADSMAAENAEISDGAPWAGIELEESASRRQAAAISHPSGGKPCYRILRDLTDEAFRQILWPAPVSATWPHVWTSPGVLVESRPVPSPLLASWGGRRMGMGMGMGRSWAAKT